MSFKSHVLYLFKTLVAGTHQLDYIRSLFLDCGNLATLLPHLTMLYVKQHRGDPLAQMQGG